MAKAPPIEVQLLELSAVRRDIASVDSRERITKALAGKSNLLAGKAATIIIEMKQADYQPQMAAAFDRFFKQGDKGCAALTPLANALYTFGLTDPAPFLLGIHHFQPEASYGPPVDVAAELRGYCALGLARLGYPDIFLELSELLMDPEPQPRMMAARALAYAGHDDGAVLLRMKVLAGDVSNDVLSECFVAMMKIAPRKSLRFVARYLDASDPELVQAAALAIGETRSADAFALLREKWESHLDANARAPLLLAIATTRLPAAIEFLLERIAEDRPAPAANAVAAMGMYKHDQVIKSKVAEMVKAAENHVLSAAFAQFFSA